MNPLTNVKNITKLNEREIALGTKVSWHDQYKSSAWVFVGGLPYDLTEGDIICVFSQWGEIVNINLIRDKKSGKSKGFCFLCYENQKSTILAVDNFNGIKIVGRTIRVDHVENYKPPKEREDDDEITKSLYAEGCAPKLPNQREDDPEVEVIQAPDSAGSEKKRKKKKKEKNKKKVKDRKKKKTKKRKAASSDSNESSSSESTEDEKAVEIKEEKYDAGYDVHIANLAPRPGNRPSNEDANSRGPRNDSPRNRSVDNMERFRHGSEKKDFNTRANYRSNNRDSKERTAGWRNEDSRDRNDRRNEDTRDRNDRRDEDPRDRNDRRDEDGRDDRRNEDSRDRFNERRNFDQKPRERSEERFQNRGGNRSKDRFLPNDRNQRFRDRSNDRRPSSRDRLDDRRFRERSNDRNRNPRARSPDPRRRSPEPRNRSFRDRSNERRNSNIKGPERRR